MTTRHKYILLLLLLSSLQNAICQRDTTAIKNIWGQAGLLGDFKDRGGFQFGLNYNVNRHLLTVRYYESNDDGLIPFIQKTRINYIQSIQNISVMVAPIVFSNKYVKFAPMVGLSYGQGNWRNSNVDTIRTNNSSGGFGGFNFYNYTYVYHYDKFQYFGLHLDLNLLWTPTKYFGVGLDVFENFHLHSDNGIAVSLVFGKLR